MCRHPSDSHVDEREFCAARYNPRVKRLILSIIICLLAGAVINVLVAWGVALTSSRPDAAWELYNAGNVDVGRTTGMLHAAHRASTRSFVNGTLIDRDELVAMLPGTSRLLAEGSGSEHYFGWPRFCQSFRITSRFAPVWSYPWASVSPHATMHDALRIESSPWSGNDVVFLPLRPIWPGFLINTLLYGATLWLLFFGFAMMRRYRRRRRGACPYCRYPRGASDVCSECGRTLPADRSESR